MVRSGAALYSLVMLTAVLVSAIGLAAMHWPGRAVDRCRARAIPASQGHSHIRPCSGRTVGLRQQPVAHATSATGWYAIKLTDKAGCPSPRSIHSMAAYRAMRIHYFWSALDSKARRCRTSA